MLTKWKSDFWTYITRHVGRVGQMNARSPKRSAQLRSSLMSDPLPAEASCETF